MSRVNPEKQTAKKKKKKKIKSSIPNENTADQTELSGEIYKFEKKV